MAKNEVYEWDSVAGNNTDVGGINIDEGMDAGDVNNAIREKMSQIKDQLPRHNFSAITAPTVDNDTTENYSVGSGWFDTTNDRMYRCIDATDGAAIWLEIGTLIQKQVGTYATYANTTTAIPHTDAIPTNAQGAEAATVTITPKLSTSVIRITNKATLSANGIIQCVLGIFQDAIVNALDADTATVDATGRLVQLTNFHEMVSGGTSAITYKSRYGGDGGTVYINGNPANRLFGGVMKNIIIAEEYAA